MQHLIRNELGDKVAKIDVIALGDGLFALGTDWEKGIQSFLLRTTAYASFGKSSRS